MLQQKNIMNIGALLPSWTHPSLINISRKHRHSDEEGQRHVRCFSLLTPTSIYVCVTRERERKEEFQVQLNWCRSVFRCLVVVMFREDWLSNVFPPPEMDLVEEIDNEQIEDQQNDQWSLKNQWRHERLVGSSLLRLGLRFDLDENK